VGEQCDAAEHQQCAQEVRIESKKKTYGYIERDELKRQEFQEQLQRKLPHQLVYVDEAGIDNRACLSLRLLQDWATLLCPQVGQTQRASQLDCGTERGKFVCANDQCNSSCNRGLFEMWLEQCLMPQLQPGDVIGN